MARGAPCAGWQKLCGLPMLAKPRLTSESSSCDSCAGQREASASAICRRSVPIARVTRGAS